MTRFHVARYGVAILLVTPGVSGLGVIPDSPVPEEPALQLDVSVTPDSLVQEEPILQFDVGETSRPVAQENTPLQAEARNGRIAFSWSDIFTIKPDGSAKKRLTNPRKESAQPEWSPDGSQIVFVCGGGYYAHARGQEICVMNADGSGRRRLTFNDTADDDPSWSPDGQWIVFTRNHGEPLEYETKLEIHKMRSDGSDDQRLTSNETYEFAPAWSPDGSHIAFESDGALGTDSGIYTMNPGGGDVQKLIDEIDRHEGQPDWSWDGTKLAYSESWVIYSYDLASGETSEIARGISPSWSPNGRWIVFHWFSERRQQDYLRKVRLSDGYVTTIHRGPGYVPDWGPKRVTQGA